MRDLSITVDHRADGRSETTRVSPGSASAYDQYSAMCLPWHEAAHAVVALHFGLVVRYVTINKAEAVEATGDPNAAGHTSLADYRGEAGPLAAVAFAGIVNDATFGFPGAQLEGDPSAAIAAAACRATFDYEQFRRLMPTPQDQRAASLLAHEILRQRRADVIAVGQALREKGRLTGQDITSVLGGAR